MNMIDFLNREKALRKASLKRERDFVVVSEPEDSDSETIVFEPSKKKKRKKSSLFATSTVFPQSSIYAKADKAFSEHTALIEKSSLLKRKKKPFVNLVAFENAKWAELIPLVSHLENESLDKYLRQVPTRTKDLTLLRQSALDHIDPEEKKAVLLKLIQLFLQHRYETEQSAKAFQKTVNTNIVKKLHPGKGEHESKNILKILLNTEKVTQSEKRHETREVLYGKFSAYESFHKDVKFVNNFLDAKYLETLDAAGFKSRDDYHEALELANRMDTFKNSKLMPLLDPKSHPANVHRANKAKNVKLKVPYPLLAGVKSDIKDIDKVFVSDYGKLHNFMQTDLKKIADNGVPITQTQPLVPFCAKLMSQFLESTVAEAKIKLELRVLIENSLDKSNFNSDKLQELIQASLWKLRIMDNFKYHLFLNFISAHLPKKLNFKESWKHFERSKRFENKYPLTPNSENLEKDEYMNAIGGYDKPFTYNQEKIGQKIFERLYSNNSDGTVKFNNYLFFQKTAKG